MKWLTIICCLACAPTVQAQSSSGCNNDPSKMREDSAAIKIKQLRLNSDASDFSPFFSGGYLYFVSGRFSGSVLEYRDDRNNSEITNLWHVKMKDSVTPSAKASLIPGNVNSKFHEGPFCLSPDGSSLYYTSNTTTSPLPKIFHAERSAAGWINPQPLPFCSDQFSYAHPSLSRGADTLWFCSDMDQGYGGMDIYYVFRDSSGWGIPRNAGPAINTGSSETFPFCGANRSLFFTSNRPGGFGGLDLYRADRVKSGFVTEHFEAPVNSAGDDFSMWTDSTAKQGYFASNRNKRSGDDIFYFYKALPDFRDARTFKPKTRFCYVFFDTVTQQLNDTVSFEFEWDYGDGKKAKGIKTRHCYNSPGRYDVKLNIVQKVSGEVFASQASYELDIESPDNVRIMGPDSSARDSCVFFTYQLEGLKDHVPLESYWLYSDHMYNTGEKVAHIFRTPGQHAVSLYIYALNTTTNRKYFLKAAKNITIN